MASVSWPLRQLRRQDLKMMMQMEKQNVSRRNRFGSLLADWRRLRRVSQMTLALDAEISQNFAFRIQQPVSHSLI